VAGEHARGVGNGFPAPELHFLAGQDDGVSPHLPHGKVEGDARARRRLLENHGHRLAGKRPGGGTAAFDAHLHRTCSVEHRTQVRCRKFDQVEEVPGVFHSGTPCSEGCGARAIFVQARSMRATASAISVSPTINGGSRRTTLSAAAAVKSLSARSASTNSPFGIAARKPTSSPSPRTSAITLG